MRSGRFIAIVGATLLLIPVAGASAQDREEGIRSIEATILDVEATIVDLDGGTRTTRSSEEVTVALEADVFFEFDDHELLPEALDVLDDVVSDIEAAAISEVVISGHTDDVGDDDYNQQLSEQRAESVEAFLAERLSGVSLQSEGFGASQPVAPNETEDGDDYPEGRAQNRRVEITYAGAQG